MCQDSAVQWSEYESHKRNVESEVRSKICVELQKLVARSHEYGDPICFINGIERAHDLVQNGIPNPAGSDNNLQQYRLF